MRTTDLPWTPPSPLPGPVETERLVLRWYEAADAPGLQAAVAGARESYLPWLPWAASTHATVEESLELIQGWADRRADPAATDFVMACFDRATGALTGGTGLHRIRPEVGEAEIGYWLHPAFRGRGLCTEATAGLITAAFGPWGFRRVRVVCAGGNRASQRVAERLGLRLEGRAREDRWIEGVGLDDTVAYAVLAPEWDAPRGRVRGT